MQDRIKPISRRQAAREAKAGRGFLLWIALYAILVASLFALNSGGPA
jgi:predicted lysophospholipase L1 biosynthesis ABC-type transport system permease subunit